MKRTHPYSQISNIERFSFLANTASGSGNSPNMMAIDAKPVPEDTGRFGDVMMYYMDYFVPIGTIWAWYGDPSDLPEGWSLCDGSNGTPDLRGKFIAMPSMGIGGCDGYQNSNCFSIDKGQVKGAPAHMLDTYEMVNHTHPYRDIFYAEKDCSVDLTHTRNPKEGSADTDNDNKGCVMNPKPSTDPQYSGTQKPISLIPPTVGVYYIQKVTSYKDLEQKGITCPGAQQCSQDKSWYCCDDPVCHDGQRTCASNAGLLECACPLGYIPSGGRW
tara:strand:+ start:622 stop:1437 length:816 start_codon:yes stop_codon:yes gene_type:complete